MRRIVFCSLALLAVSACARTAPSVSRTPDQVVTVAGTGQQVVLSGEMTTSRITVGNNTEPRHDLVVRVNGQPAVSGTLVTYGATRLDGRAGVMPVEANCQSTEIGHADRQFNCIVSLNGQAAGTMAFRASPVGPLPPVVGG